MQLSNWTILGLMLLAFVCGAVVALKDEEEAKQCSIGAAFVCAAIFIVRITLFFNSAG
jgi:uncharacterized membrane protein YoaK (UPF0700 family)